MSWIAVSWLGRTNHLDFSNQTVNAPNKEKLLLE